MDWRRQIIGGYILDQNFIEETISIYRFGDKIKEVKSYHFKELSGKYFCAFKNEYQAFEAAIQEALGNPKSTEIIDIDYEEVKPLELPEKKEI